jgi:hypothetical protein
LTLIGHSPDDACGGFRVDSMTVAAQVRGRRA